MDHAQAHILEFGPETSATKTITSKFTHLIKEDALNKSENVMHNKEQHQESDYFRNLGEVIKQYNEVVLFGPTNAKAELHNLLKANHAFEKIQIETKQADKMTGNQQYAFVKEYFENKNLHKS
jgi:hypothetical protein